MSSLAVRIASVKEELKVLVKQHEENTFPEGAEALSAKVEDILDRANLMENRTCNVDRLGVFPGNRETAMLIPVEVQHLLHESLLKNGWNASKWNCMALTVPDSLRDEWAKANNDLVLRAQGHLPAIHDMELATGRGSHGTAALRSVLFSCKSIYIDIADSNGHISMAKCLEQQPSLKAPLEEGIVMAPEDARNVSKLRAFVTQWSGGEKVVCSETFRTMSKR